MQVRRVLAEIPRDLPIMHRPMHPVQRGSKEIEPSVEQIHHKHASCEPLRGERIISKSSLGFNHPAETHTAALDLKNQNNPNSKHIVHVISFPDDPS